MTVSRSDPAAIIVRGILLESVPRKRLGKRTAPPPSPSQRQEDATCDDSNDSRGRRFLFHRTRATSVDSSVKFPLSSRGTFVHVLEIPRRHRRSIAPSDFRAPRTKKAAYNFIGEPREREKQRAEVADKNG